MRSLIGAFRLLVFFVTSLFTLAYQSTVMLFTKGEFAYYYPRAYHAFLCHLFGIKVIVEGHMERGRNIVYLGNHLSYLDIQALGSILLGSFVARKDLADWPFFGWMARMQRTVFISRDPKDAAAATKLLEDRIAEGLPLVIFPEGTSSSGEEIFPFKSSFFEIFLNKNIRIQPFTISLLAADEKPAVDTTIRDIYAWYGDMPLGRHLWRVAKAKEFVVKVTFQEAIASSSYNNRKLLCSDVYEAVAKGLDLSPLSQ